MKMSEALEIIKGEIRPKGFRVSFEKIRGCMLHSGYFPEHGEELIKTETEAWLLAKGFALKLQGNM